jgi:hypothetical protein
VRYENACAGDKQAKYTHHDDPVRDTNEPDMARRRCCLNCCFNASFANHYLTIRSFGHRRSKKEPRQYKLVRFEPYLI